VRRSAVPSRHVFVDREVVKRKLSLSAVRLADDVSSCRAVRYEPPFFIDFRLCSGAGRGHRMTLSSAAQSAKGV
jgi:hypothetical protein